MGVEGGGGADEQEGVPSSWWGLPPPPPWAGLTRCMLQRRVRRHQRTCGRRHADFGRVRSLAPLADVPAVSSASGWVRLQVVFEPETDVVLPAGSADDKGVPGRCRGGGQHVPRCWVLELPVVSDHVGPCLHVEVTKNACWEISSLTLQPQHESKPLDCRAGKEVGAIPVTPRRYAAGLRGG